MMEPDIGLAHPLWTTEREHSCFSLKCNIFMNVILNNQSHVFSYSLNLWTSIFLCVILVTVMREVGILLKMQSTVKDTSLSRCWGFSEELNWTAFLFVVFPHVLSSNNNRAADRYPNEDKLTLRFLTKIVFRGFNCNGVSLLNLSVTNGSLWRRGTRGVQSLIHPFFRDVCFSFPVRYLKVGFHSFGRSWKPKQNSWIDTTAHRHLIKINL